MPGRLGVDFGTSNTVFTLWNESSRDSETLPLKNYAHKQETANSDVYVVPSLIYYGERGEILYGNEVRQNNLQYSPRTFQWMKRYIGRRDPAERLVNHRMISHFEAGHEFLSHMLKTASEYLLDSDEEIAFTVPVEAFEDYSNWLSRVVNKAGLWRFRVLDEPSAAALGYGAEFEPDDVFMVFDFGGGTLDVAIVQVQENKTVAGRYCRTVGKAGIDFGGATIDEWLYREVLLRNGRSDEDDEVKAIGRLILRECELLKESLSFNAESDIQVLDPMSGALNSATFTQTEFEKLLDENDGFLAIDRTIRRAMHEAIRRGLHEEKIKAVLMVGGCSQIPSVQKTLRRIFGNDRVLIKRPLDAVARGASAFVAGVGFKDYIQHDYAVRHVNSKTGSYEYRTIVSRGTRYPTGESVASLTIKASYDGQDRLGVPIFEVSGNTSMAGDLRVEISFDDGGIPRIHSITEDDFARRHLFWINQNNPTFLEARPLAMKGERRFKLDFSIDENRRLLMTAHDVLSGLRIFDNFPVAKLL